VRESQTVEKARCALGAQLAANRRAVGYSQAELAPLTGYSRSTIANVETGRQHVPRDFWERADAAVNAGGVLAAANDEVEAAARHEREETARAARAARQAQAEQWRAQHAKGAAQQQRAAGSGWTETIDQAHAVAASLWSGDPGDTDTAAEDASPAGTAVALRWLIAPPDPSAARLDGWRLIGSGDLARLHGVRRCLKDIDNAHGGGAALPMAVSYVRREIPPLLDGRYDDATGRGLFEVAAEFQHDVGWMAYDADRQDLAACYFAHALRFAHAAGNRLLGGRILAAMSHQAIYLGHIAQAIDLARAARAGTTQLATPHALAMLAAMEACALAAAGETKLCQQALGDAETALTGNLGDGPEPEWLDFDEGGYWGHAARVYRDLGEPERAEQCAERSVAQCLTGHRRTHSQRSTIQAAARLQLGDVDAAAAVGEEVVREAWNLHSGHVFGEVSALARAIAAVKTPAAAGFLDQARELLAARAAGAAVAGS